jgi:hypothetical protein
VLEIPTFLIAGHETTATATTWCLYALSLNPTVQQKLREELLKVDTEYPSMDEINALPYLDCVIRETLRVHAPVPSTIRVAMEDDVLPLSEPFVDKTGKTLSEVMYVYALAAMALPLIPIIEQHSKRR